MNKLTDENDSPLVKFDNYAKREIRDGRWFKWLVFVNEPDKVLEKIDHVEYLLHPTFPNPRRYVDDREHKFGLEDFGTGPFHILITILFKDGKKQEQRYWVSLHEKWPEEKQVQLI